MYPGFHTEEPGGIYGVLLGSVHLFTAWEVIRWGCEQVDTARRSHWPCENAVTLAENVMIMQG